MHVKCSIKKKLVNQWDTYKHPVTLTEQCSIGLFYNIPADFKVFGTTSDKGNNMTSGFEKIHAYRYYHRYEKVKQYEVH